MQIASLDKILPDADCRVALGKIGRTKWSELDRLGLLPPAIKIFGNKQGRLESQMADLIARLASQPNGDAEQSRLPLNKATNNRPRVSALTPSIMEF
jgi:hypothetical protein